MNNNYTKLAATIAALASAMVLISSTTFQAATALIDTSTGERSRAPMATSGYNNVYIVWWSNKTGNDEVMFKASTDGGKTFGSKMNLSNTPKSNSQDAEIAASGNNVYGTLRTKPRAMNQY
jgi:hypothetical protein